MTSLRLVRRCFRTCISIPALPSDVVTAAVESPLVLLLLGAVVKSFDTSEVPEITARKGGITFRVVGFYISLLM